MRYFARIFVALLALTCWVGPATAQSSTRHILLLDQSAPFSPWGMGYRSELRKELFGKTTSPIALYSETLDLAMFQREGYDEIVLAYLRDKYRDKEISVVVTHGLGALEQYLRLRARLWPNAPVVASLFDATDLVSFRNQPNMTGTIVRLSFSDALKSAKSVVPGLKQLVLVGDPFERQPFRKHYVSELQSLRGDVEFVDLSALTMAEIKERVSKLPEDSAIFYTAIYRDGAGVVYAPIDGAMEVSQAANRPVITDNGAFIGIGVTGGIVARFELFAQKSAQLVLRILAGERADDIPITVSENGPIFDWRQLQRFGVSERNLPADSDLRFKEPTFWERYRLPAIGVLFLVLFQSALISWLLFERRRRRNAEVKSHGRLLETMHLNRSATAGALSASVAHELNQPLGAILSNTEAAEKLLSSGNADPVLLQEILVDIRRDDQRAGEIIRRLRGLLSKSELKFQEFELDEELHDVARMLDGESRKRGVSLHVKLGAPSAHVRADKVHLQQVMLNIAMNGMDAMAERDTNDKQLSFQSARKGSQVEVTILDNGCGIPEDKLKKVFDTFYTTKQQGTGLGLSIARTIIETYGGKIWVENRLNGGSAFSFSLPLTEARMK